jgi:hypothetical protein
MVRRGPAPTRRLAQDGAVQVAYSEILFPVCVRRGCNSLAGRTGGLGCGAPGATTRRLTDSLRASRSSGPGFGPWPGSSKAREGSISVTMKSWTAALILLGACIAGLPKPVEAQLRWADPPKRAPMRVRLVAVALAVPRSSFFSSREVFVAETEIEHDEWSLIKLVFNFLPYQPGLLDSGFDYSVVHEISAWRDPDCDETVEQLTARSAPDRHEPLVYSRHVPREDLDRRRIPLACYETDADEYIRSSVEPTGPVPAPTTPLLKERSERSNLKPVPLLEGPYKAQLIPFLEQPLNPNPTPALGVRANAKPIPFLGEQSSVRPTPSRNEASTPKPIPFLDESSTPKPIPFLDDGYKPNSTPSLKARAKPRPTPPPKKPSTPKIISDTD